RWQPGDGDRDRASPPSSSSSSSSFAEVLRLVQSGQEPPGVRKPRATPTGDSPTASRGPPPAKPPPTPPRGWGGWTVGLSVPPLRRRYTALKTGDV
uniref:Peroxisomal membrane protein PEX14-like KPWE domain-containing protein n=1 Tax=Calidris pygmaea TaxID=425635 RepID=A0A8C3PMC9_9CHAR